MRKRITAGIIASLLVLGLGACDAMADGKPAPVPHLEAPIERASIGANIVPNNLHCEEDEVIAFVVDEPAPYDLGCVHVEKGVLEE